VSEKLYVARRTFDYDESLSLDRGQCFNLHGYPADEKLIRLGYVEEYRERDRPLPCRCCGATFMDMGSLNMHGNKRHSGEDRQSLVPTGDMRAQQDIAAERAMIRENEVAPLYLDKTEGKPIKRKAGRPRIHP
jgi:hypothetical protein